MLPTLYVGTETLRIVFRSEGTPYPLDRCLDDSEVTSTVVEFPGPMPLRKIISEKRPTILTQLQDFAGVIKVHTTFTRLGAE